MTKSCSVANARRTSNRRSGYAPRVRCTIARTSSAPWYVFPLAIRCIPSTAYHATTASTSCSFHAAAHPVANASLTRSSRTTAVAGRDEHDLAHGQPHTFTLGGAPHEDL